MISKLSAIITATAAVTVITNKPTAQLTAPTSTPAPMDCMSYLLHGGNSCVTITSVYYGVVATNPDCVDAATYCSLASTQISSYRPSTSWTSSSPFATLMKCPGLNNICAGSADDLQKTIDDTTTAEVTIVPVGNLVQGAGCTYRLKTVCGSPVISTTSNTPVVADLDAYIFHYTNDGRATSPVIAADAAQGAGYPASNSVPIDISLITTSFK